MLLQYTKLTVGGVLLLNPADLDAPMLESYLKIERENQAGTIYVSTAVMLFLLSTPTV